MMDAREIIYTIALTQAQGIGVTWGRNLLRIMGSATAVFEQQKEIPARVPGSTRRMMEALSNRDTIASAEKEYAFTQENGIRCLTLNDKDYPSRLRECDDAPLVLFYKGNAGLNAARVINMVGTRNATDYGKERCACFLSELKTVVPDVLVVSGLAYGIDIHTHRGALQNGFPTVGVLAHGLDRIYPSAHRKTAIEMLQQGGLLTEFLTGTNPEPYNFVSRNRIVAGMSDATIVVESATKGGSLITAELANGYNRDCFAFPGRVNDIYSQGCNKLIRENKAALIESADDLVRLMRWDITSIPAKPLHVQRTLFPELNEDETKIIEALRQGDNVHINNLTLSTGIPVHQMSVLLFGLEMKGILKVMAGNTYQLM